MLTNGGAELKLLQNKLGVPQTGVLDAATRAAVLGWKRSHGLPATDDTLQSSVIMSILKP